MMNKVNKYNEIFHNDDNRFIPPIDFKYEAAAMRNLNGNAFKLWHYILSWHDKKSFNFLPSVICNELGFGENEVTEARKELERKGYITKDDDKVNNYFFTPVLPKDYEELKDKQDYDIFSFN